MWLEGEDGVSRASSVSGKDRVNTNSKRKTKQRRDDSESFDTRSNYVSIAWSAGPQQPTWAPVTSQYFPVNGGPFTGQQYQNPYPVAGGPIQPIQPVQPVQPVYGQNQAYPQMIPNNGFPPQYNGVPTVSLTHSCQIELD